MFSRIDKFHIKIVVRDKIFHFIFWYTSQNKPRSTLFRLFLINNNSLTLAFSCYQVQVIACFLLNVNSQIISLNLCTVLTRLTSLRLQFTRFLHGWDSILRTNINESVAGYCAVEFGDVINFCFNWNILSKEKKWFLKFKCIHLSLWISVKYELLFSNTFNWTNTHWIKIDRFHVIIVKSLCCLIFPFFLFFFSQIRLMINCVFVITCELWLS